MRHQDKPRTRNVVTNSTEAAELILQRAAEGIDPTVGM